MVILNSIIPISIINDNESHKASQSNEEGTSKSKSSKGTFLFEF